MSSPKKPTIKRSPAKRPTVKPQKKRVQVKKRILAMPAGQF